MCQMSLDVVRQMAYFFCLSAVSWVFTYRSYELFMYLFFISVVGNVRTRIQRNLINYPVLIFSRNVLTPQAEWVKLFSLILLKHLVHCCRSGVARCIYFLSLFLYQFCFFLSYFINYFSFFSFFLFLFAWLKLRMQALYICLFDYFQLLYIQFGSSCFEENKEHLLSRYYSLISFLFFSFLHRIEDK